MVAHRAAMGAKQTTGTPLRERVGDLQVAHGPAPDRGRYQFFAVISLSA